MLKYAIGQIDLWLKFEAYQNKKHIQSFRSPESEQTNQFHHRYTHISKGNQCKTTKKKTDSNFWKIIPICDPNIIDDLYSNMYAMKPFFTFSYSFSFDLCLPMSGLFRRFNILSHRMSPLQCRLSAIFSTSNNDLLIGQTKIGTRKRKRFDTKHSQFDLSPINGFEIFIP